MVAGQLCETSLIERDKRRTSAFRPPKFFKSTPPQRKTLTADAAPWSPAGATDDGRYRIATPKPAIAPPKALGTSPVQRARPCPHAPPELSELMATPSSNSSLFSPLSTPVNTFFHTFSEEATEERVYPVDMFMSVRKDASHTPHGVLKWCVRQYVEIPTLKVPSHLRLSMNEAVNSDDGVTRGALGSGLKTKMRNKPIRLTHHKVMSVLSRITRAKYNELLEELVQLPLRQSDDAELQEVVKVFFEKSVQEHEYSDLYAQLVKELCSIKESERELDPKLQDRLLCNRMRVQLVAACKEQFRRPIELTADEKVDRTTGKPFGEEEIEMKRMRMKNRLVGNVKFVGELYKLDLVTDHIVENILNFLVGRYSAAEPTAKEEYVFEVFATLIKTSAPILKKKRPLLLSHFLAIAKTVERTHTKPRVRFLMMDLGDLNEKNNWIDPERVLREADSSNGANAGARSKPTNGNPFTSSCGPDAGSYSTNKSNPVVPPCGLPNSRSTSFAYDDNTLNSIGTPHSPTPLQQQQPPPPQQQQQQAYPQYHMHQPQPLSSLPMSASNSTNDFAFSLPRSRSSAASLQASINAGSTSAKNTSTSAVAGTATQTPLSKVVTPAVSRDTAASGPAQPPQLYRGPKGPLAEVDGSAGSGRAYSLKDVSQASRANNNSSTAGGLTPMNQTSQSSPLSYTPAERNSPFTPAVSISEMSSAGTSDGNRTPIIARQQRVAALTRHTAATAAGTDIVNLQDITRQLMEMYNDPAQSANVVHCVCEMALKNKVLCLTWWLRLVATNTALFAERQRVTNLLCDILSVNPAAKPEELFAAVVEWIRFDVERGLYDNCPRMFDNIAHMVLYCHSHEASGLNRIEAVRELLHAGLFNVMLHGLTTDRGTDQMVTLVKSAHPVSIAMMGTFTDPSEDAAVLRIAVENRFRLLPYFLSVSSGTESDMPGTPASRCRTPTTPSMRSPLGDSITSTVHYDPLSRCLSFHRVSEDPEMQLFRRIRTECLERSSNNSSSSASSNGNGGASASWRDEAVKLGITPVGNNSLVSQVLQVMKVVGALLACTSVTQHTGSLLSFAEVDGAVKELLARRPGTVFEAAAIVELMLHFTQSLNGNSATLPRKSTRIKPLRQSFARWCTQGIVHKTAVMELIRAVESTAPSPRAFTTYYNAIADNELQWHSTLTCLS